jgi:tRNA threonylcarbamoyladenosine biosynthesis protein TsaB
VSVILAIETSTPQGSVAVLKTGGVEPSVLFFEAFPAGRSLSSELFIVLERALEAGSKEPMDEIVVGLGPGSYAGVRIAISAATGLALARDARLTGIASIATLDRGDYIAIGDARRESFYFALVRGGVCEQGPELLSADELTARLATLRPLPVFASEITPGMEGLKDFGVELRYPCAERIARLAAAGKSIIARDLLEPIYLRDPHITQPKKG